VRTREELEQRVAQLERELAATRGSRYVRSVRARAGWQLGGLPFYDIAIGPDFSRGENRGHAKGVIAIGDIATGAIAVGGLARGVIAVGGAAVGLLTFGGLSVGALAAFGGLAVGGVAFGGAAMGAVAMGGGVAGYYACGGGAAGEYVVAPYRIDPEGQRFFAEYFPAATTCGINAGARSRRRY
jgi:hypothetical protein